MKTAEEKLREARRRLNALRGSSPYTEIVYLDESKNHFSLRTVGGEPTDEEVEEMPLVIVSEEERREWRKDLLRRALDDETDESLKTVVRILVRDGFYDEKTAQALGILESPLVDEVRDLRREVDFLHRYVEILRAAIWAPPKEKLAARKETTFYEKCYKEERYSDYKDWEHRK